MAEVKYIEVGGVVIRSDLGELVSLSDFSKVYKNHLKDLTVEQAYEKLGGTIEKPKPKKRKDVGEA